MGRLPATRADGEAVTLGNRASGSGSCLHRWTCAGDRSPTCVVSHHEGRTTRVFDPERLAPLCERLTRA